MTNSIFISLMLLSSAEIYIVYFSLGWCQALSLLLTRSLFLPNMTVNDWFKQSTAHCPVIMSLEWNMTRPCHRSKAAVFFYLLKNCNFRSMLAEPVFTYSYGYSFGILILSFLLSEFTGLAVFPIEPNLKIISLWIQSREMHNRYLKISRLCILPFLEAVQLLFFITFRNLCNISVHLPPSTQMGSNWEKYHFRKFRFHQTF